MTSKQKKILLSIGVAVVLFLFAFSLFKNIAYPLLWNDEASTAMFGRRVLEYGYPKAHDDKNYLYYFNDPNHNIALRSKGDVHIAEGWMQHYLAAFGEYFAQKTDDIYIKTAILRIPFAVAGFLSVIIFGLIVSAFFKGNKKKAFIAFFLFELVSISLVLHLREVRYYSLILLFSAVLIYVHLGYTILKTISFKRYLWITSLFIVLLFHTHYPVAAIFIITFGLHHFILSYQVCEKKFSIFWKIFLRRILPLFISLVFIIPSLIYFKTFEVVRMISNESKLAFSHYINNIIQAVSFFAKFEFLYLAIFLKIVFVILLFYKRYPLNAENKILSRASNFLTLFFGVYIFVIARTVFVFERYIIVLQPVLVFIILLDILLCWRLINRNFIKKIEDRKRALGIFLGIIFIAVYMNITPHMEVIKGHIYELGHRYYGSLDYVIPYIQKKYDNPSSLIIATNYEENSYMYYLNSKTTIGYVGNNLEEDSKLEPDIIVLRKYFILGQKGYLDIFNTFLSKKEYQDVNFPVYDYPFNNIPELNFNAPHLFETRFASNDSEKLYLYFKK